MRADLERRWMTLTREDLPRVARDRDWPIHLDHCFQRVLLDQACRGCWYDRIEGRPAYRAAPEPILRRAVELGEAVLAGLVDLDALNAQSLRWRRQ
ncbi:GCN5-related N-acetyltransferase [Salipiger sp. IMCC34102]|uniref:GCN5-related N-acetyltransferase n=1 Tax=Salipiger sp. IMCC34102 TaxID=2510647 RepID=UPI00101B7FB9|nr:GCN5-related N-acetyltransferase [Salipiger sp. IMCC34102]RYH02821.1 GCN5-related N-acetyltransferase [Salipiger sp. IMCC34102]